MVNSSYKLEQYCLILLPLLTKYINFIFSGSYPSAPLMPTPAGPPPYQTSPYPPGVPSTGMPQPYYSPQPQSYSHPPSTNYSVIPPALPPPAPGPYPGPPMAGYSMHPPSNIGFSSSPGYHPSIPGPPLHQPYGAVPHGVHYKHGM